MDKSKLQSFNILRHIQAGDTTTFKWFMQRKHQTIFTQASRWISKTADGIYYPAIPLALWLTESPEALAVFTILCTAFVIERPIYFILKRTCKRNRPADTLAGFNSFVVPSDKFSFPSGHTSGAFLVATVITACLPVLMPFCFLWATSVAVSRIFLGVHFPSDTLAGASFGTGTGLLVLNFIWAGFI